MIKNKYLKNLVFCIASIMLNIHLSFANSTHSATTTKNSISALNAFAKAQNIVTPFTNLFFDLITNFAVPATLINLTVIIFSSGEKRVLARKILVGVIIADIIALTKSNFFISIGNLFTLFITK